MIRKLSNIVRKELLINGVYKIINTKNKKFYIGSCSSKTFLYERLKHHYEDLLKNKHCNLYLQRSFNKYGIENFEYEILEICKPEDCIRREQYWMNILKPEYNLCKIAGNTLGVECIQETRDKISSSNKRWWFKEENRLKMIKSFSKRPKKDKKIKIKIKKEFHGLCKKVINLETNEIYNSAIEASQKLNMTYTYIIAICNGKRRSTKKLKYV